MPSCRHAPARSCCRRCPTRSRSRSPTTSMTCISRSARAPPMAGRRRSCIVARADAVSIEEACTAAGLSLQALHAETALIGGAARANWWCCSTARNCTLRARARAPSPCPRTRSPRRSRWCSATRSAERRQRIARAAGLRLAAGLGGARRRDRGAARRSSPGSRSSCCRRARCRGWRRARPGAADQPAAGRLRAAAQQFARRLAALAARGGARLRPDRAERRRQPVARKPARGRRAARSTLRSPKRSGRCSPAKPKSAIRAGASRRSLQRCAARAPPAATSCPRSPRSPPRAAPRRTPS